MIKYTLKKDTPYIASTQMGTKADGTPIIFTGPFEFRCECEITYRNIEQPGVKPKGFNLDDFRPGGKCDCLDVNKITAAASETNPNMMLINLDLTMANHSLYTRTITKIKEPTAGTIINFG